MNNRDNSLVQVSRAFIYDIVSGVYSEALFYHQNELYEVFSIKVDTVVAATVQIKNVEEVQLPINVV